MASAHTPEPYSNLAEVMGAMAAEVEQLRDDLNAARRIIGHPELLAGLASNDISPEALHDLMDQIRAFQAKYGHISEN